MRLDMKILSLPGVEKKESRWGHMTAYWIGKREFVHFHGEDRLDIRVVRSALKDMPEIRLDRRVMLRPRASDWIEFRLREQSDVNDAFRLVKLAWKNNRQAGR
jgi:hypothetical protein